MRGDEALAEPVAAPYAPSVRRFVAAMVGAAGVAACNALTGVGDLSTDEVAGSSSGSSGSSGTSGGGDGGRVPLDATLPKAGGSLDTTFGANGVVLSGLLDVVTSVALHSDGRIAVAGASSGQLAVVQLTASGAIDTAFGSEGRVLAGALTTSRADAVLVDPSDRVVAGGAASGAGIPGGPAVTGLVVRIAGNKLDTTFGSGGKRVFAVDGETVAAIVSSPLGGYFAAGRAPNPTSSTVGALWSITTSGSDPPNVQRIDISFASSSPSGIVAMVPGSGGASLVVAGTVTGALQNPKSATDFAVGRLVASGLDPAFNGDGKAIVDVATSGDTAFAVAGFAGGAYAVGGEVLGATGSMLARSPQVGIVRVDATGNLDKAWAIEGKAVTSFAALGDLTPNLGDHLRGIAVDAQGRVIAVGFVEDAMLKSRRPVILRLSAQGGTNDLFFGTFGLVTSFFDAKSTDSSATAIVLQPDGKLVMVGTASGQLAVARLNP